jgi:hypothetical protein
MVIEWFIVPNKQCNKHSILVVAIFGSDDFYAKSLRTNLAGLPSRHHVPSLRYRPKNLAERMLISGSGKF